MNTDRASLDPAGRDPGHPAHDLVVPADRLDLDPSAVARLAHCDPPRWEIEIRAGIDEGRSLLEARARWIALDATSLDGLFAGGTPVEEIAARGECWAFVATIGRRLESRVAEHLARGRYLEGVLLDAAGSVSVEAVCDLVERGCAGAGPSARFSPGYCRWSLESQRAIFGLLRPEEIDVELLPSLLMQPLKSVSGIIVKAGSPDDLLVPPEECAPCEAVGCPRREVEPESGR